MDSPTNIPLIERVANSIQQLSAAAQDLNTVSGELGKAITAIDTVLQALNIGIPTWTRIAGGDDLPDETGFWRRELGYAKIGSRWGIALQEISGDYNYPERYSCESWHFSDAPRWLRIEGAGKIPELIDELIKKTRETTQEIKTKTVEVNELATAIAQAAGNNKNKTSGAHVFLSGPVVSSRLPARMAGPDDYVPPDSSFPIFVPPSADPKSNHSLVGKKPKAGK
jgi:hypothetical protein